MDIVARRPGSVYDSTIFNNSRLSALLENGNFNKAHVITRNTIERCFGVLKKRFAILSSGLRTAMTTNMAIIVACAVA